MNNLERGYVGVGPRPLDRAPAFYQQHGFTSRSKQVMILPCRALRAPRRLREQFLRALQAVTRSSRAPPPTGQDARGRHLAPRRAH